jgi:hypothetical protein
LGGGIHATILKALSFRAAALDDFRDKNEPAAAAKSTGNYNSIISERRFTKRRFNGIIRFPKSLLEGFLL